jgi:hypothetical protein
MHRTSSLFLALGALTLSLAAPLRAEDNTLTDQQKADGWVALFDGKTLDGWAVKSGFARYAVVDGAVVGTTASNSPNSFLTSDKAYGDFELTMDVKLDDGGLNSGLQIRSKLKGEQYGGRLYGPQVEICPGVAGYIYGEATKYGWLSQERKPHKLFALQQWVPFRVRAVGPKIETWICGEKVAELTLQNELATDHLEGRFGLQVHGVGAKGPFTVRWKNIYLKPLAATK